MSKKKTSSSSDDSWLPPVKQGRTGRPAKMPEGLQECLADFTKLTEAWLNRCREVWFGGRYGRLDEAVGASEHEESPEWYKYAIGLIEEVARCAKEGKQRLKTGKADAERRLAQKKNRLTDAPNEQA